MTRHCCHLSNLLSAFQSFCLASLSLSSGIVARKAESGHLLSQAVAAVNRLTASSCKQAWCNGTSQVQRRSNCHCTTLVAGRPQTHRIRCQWPALPDGHVFKIYVASAVQERINRFLRQGHSFIPSLLCEYHMLPGLRLQTGPRPQN